MYTTVICPVQCSSVRILLEIEFCCSKETVYKSLLIYIWEKRGDPECVVIWPLTLATSCTLGMLLKFSDLVF